MDGNSTTYSRCRWILLSNSVLIKPASPNVQWYYSQMRPFVHYVPVDENFSELKTVYDWLNANGQEAKQIAKAGQDLGEQIFSQDGIEHYVLFLLDEYKKRIRN